MKKIVIIINMLLLFLIFATPTYAYEFSQTSDTVSFSGNNFTVLQSPFNTAYTTQYILFPDEIFLTRSIQTTYNSSTKQVNYSSLATFTDELVYFNRTHGQFAMSEFTYVNQYEDIRYQIKIAYTFTNPVDVIAKINNQGWFQISSSKVSKIILEFNADDYNYEDKGFYLTWYSSTGVYMGSSGQFGGSNTDIGLAFYGVSTVDYNIGFEVGYDTGFNDAVNSNKYIWEQNGYRQGQEDYYNGVSIYDYFDLYPMSESVAFQNGFDLGYASEFGFDSLIEYLFKPFELFEKEIAFDITIGHVAMISIVIGLMGFLFSIKGKR